MTHGEKQRLERQRAILVQELARINKRLRGGKVVEAVDDDWDFDPRFVSEAA